MKPGINIHLYPSPLQNESRIFKQTESLANAKFFEKIWLIGIGSEGLPMQQRLDEVREIIRVGKKCEEMSTLLGKIQKTLKYWIGVLKIIKNEPIQVVQIHNLSLLPLGVVIKIWKKSKLVYDAHELETERVGWGHGVKRAAKIVERFFIKFSDHTIVVSPEIAKHYEASYPNIKPTVILNAPKLAQCKKRNLFRERFNIRDDQTIFIYQGSISDNRGLELILDTFLQLKDKNNVLIFMGYGPFVAQVEEASKKCNTIFFMPAVHPKQVLEYTASADYGITLMVFPDACLSYYYCLPNKLFEYCLAGLPIITSNAIEMRRFVENNQLGVVVKEKSIKDLETAINEIKKIPYDTMHTRCLSIAKEVCWEIQEPILLNIYSGLK
ncbi:MAG: glycosyltransferase [Candidatus Margulisbacteria bacterium]|nr:glycosyltransferase [Candidatus Margulisiibacteriota bacterium]